MLGPGGRSHSLRGVAGCDCRTGTACGSECPACGLGAALSCGCRRCPLSPLNLSAPLAQQSLNTPLVVEKHSVCCCPCLCPPCTPSERLHLLILGEGKSRTLFLPSAVLSPREPCAPLKGPRVPPPRCLVLCSKGRADLTVGPRVSVRLVPHFSP